MGIKTEPLPKIEKEPTIQAGFEILQHDTQWDQAEMHEIWDQFGPSNITMDDLAGFLAIAIDLNSDHDKAMDRRAVTLECLKNLKDGMTVNELADSVAEGTEIRLYMKLGEIGSASQCLSILANQESSKWPDKYRGLMSSEAIKNPQHISAPRMWMLLQGDEILGERVSGFMDDHIAECTGCNRQKQEEWDTTIKHFVDRGEHFPPPPDDDYWDHSYSD